VSDEQGRIVESGPIELRATSSMEATGSVISGSDTIGEQTLAFAEANIQIQIEDAAHHREIEKQRVQRELDSAERSEEEDFKDRHWQRIRDNCTYAVVVGLIVVGLVACFLVAVNATDPSLKTWAQGLTTTIAGVVGGAFAGYLIGERK
jgi:hypothetical protein